MYFYYGVHRRFLRVPASPLSNRENQLRRRFWQRLHWRFWRAASDCSGGLLLAAAARIVAGGGWRAAAAGDCGVRRAAAAGDCGER
jgi:hypothetical protein